MKKVLFLCTGNYYRSRFAEQLFNWHAENKRLPWRAESKGLAVGRWGNIGPISSHTIKRLNGLGISTNGNSRFPEPVAETDFADASIVIAMKEAEHREILEKRFSVWADRVEYWQIDDLDCAEPDDALPALENKVLALLASLNNEKHC